MASVQAQPAPAGGDHGTGDPGTAPVRPIGRGTLLRYRVMALTTATLLLPLVFVATPLKLFWQVSGPAAIIGFVHGWLYVLYLVFGFEISIKLKLPLGRMLLVLLAGTVPFAGFFAERYVTRLVRQAQPPAGTPTP